MITATNALWKSIDLLMAQLPFISLKLQTPEKNSIILSDAFLEFLNQENIISKLLFIDFVVLKN